MDDGFLDQYSNNTDAGIGTVHSCRYSKQNNAIQSNQFLSCCTCINNGQIQLYGLFSGFNGGSTTANFVMKRFVHELFQENPLAPGLTPVQVMEEIRTKFEKVAERYLMSLSDILNERLLKLEEETESGNNRVSEINQKIRQGSTALIAIKIIQDLYILNCGSSLALAITHETAVQLNDNLHNKDNAVENSRLKALGIDPSTVLNPTRAIGDLQRTHLYEESNDFCNANGPPVISTPDIWHYKIDSSWQHLVLLSDGVVQNLKEAEVDDIPTEVFVRLIEDHTLTSTAQALADAFARKHFDAFITMQKDTLCCISNHREEMAVVIVKLSTGSQDLYETFDSALSTIDSTSNTLSGTSLVPYVDASRLTTGKNFEKMNKIILSS
ncbi:unnamed protein product [Caenorhabditis sp. 36 PRJEB53466]|nr:unnamed protein product [Caenorhabditis sp. 36 PRJEB53466]